MRLDIGAFFKKREKFRAEWRPWFAWNPVFVDGVLVWLETVERFMHMGDNVWIYRLRRKKAGGRKR